MTAYKYVARDAESRVNWGDISKTWSDAILKVETDREAKRQTIKTETDELANKLIAAPRGQHKGANEWTAGYADLQQQALLDRYRQLTSGNLSVRDWNSSLANAKQSTEQMFNLSKVYQEEYASIMERDQNLESQEAELALAAEFEGFTNFTDTVPLVDPVTLNATIGKQTYDPETGTYRVGETITMNGMYNLLKGRYNRFDIQAAAAEDIKTLGEYTTVEMDGYVKTRENWQDDPLYKQELNAKIDVHFSDPQNITSVLTNSMNSGYSSTGLLENVLDKDGNVDEKKVFWVTNPAQASAGAKTPLISLDIQLDDNGNITGRSEAELDDIFGENVSDAERSALVRAAKKQEEEAAAFMRTYYTAEVDLIETPMAEPSSKTPSDSKEKGKTSAKTGLNNLQAIYTAKEETKDNMIGAINYFEGLNPGLDLEVVNRNNTRTLAIKRDGEEDTRYVSMETDYPTFVESVTSFVMPKNQYLSSALDENPLPEGSTRGTALGGVTMERAVDVENIGAETVKYTNDKGKEVQETFRTFIERLPAPDTGVTSQLGNVDEDTIFTVNEVKSALDQLDLSDDIKVEAILESTLEDLYGRSWMGTSTIDYPGIQIQAPNMPNGIVISHESGEAASLGPVLELIATGKTVSIEELYDLMGEESIAITKELIENGHLNVEQPEIPNPNANTPEVDAFGNPI